MKLQSVFTGWQLHKAAAWLNVTLCSNRSDVMSSPLTKARWSCEHDQLSGAIFILRPVCVCVCVCVCEGDRDRFSVPVCVEKIWTLTAVQLFTGQLLDLWTVGQKFSCDPLYLL